MIDVLLVSPRLTPTDVRYGGDNAYTDTLLQYPPAGVRYHHYEDLMVKSQVRKMKNLYRTGPRLVRWGILPPDLWAEYLVSDFIPDLLHIVSFTAKVRFPNAVAVPTILHISSPSITDLMVKRDWDKRRVARFYRWKKLYLRMVGAHHYALNPDQAAEVLVQSKYGRDLLSEYGNETARRAQVIYPGQPCRRDGVTRSYLPRTRITFLFVGSDFERKNGPLVIEAFRRVRASCPFCKLILIGKPADGKHIEMEGISHRFSVPREEMMERYYPEADVFVLPTNAEGSFAYSIFEAMSFGMPVITANEWAMPELIQDGENGFLLASDDLNGLIECMMRLATSSDLLIRMRKRSTEIFLRKFSIETHNEHLSRIYDQVLGGAQSVETARSSVPWSLS